MRSFVFLDNWNPSSSSLGLEGVAHGRADGLGRADGALHEERRGRGRRRRQRQRQRQRRQLAPALLLLAAPVVLLVVVVVASVRRLGLRRQLDAGALQGLGQYVLGRPPEVHELCELLRGLGPEGLELWHPLLLLLLQEVELADGLQVAIVQAGLLGAASDPAKKGSSNETGVNDRTLLASAAVKMSWKDAF